MVFKSFHMGFIRLWFVSSLWILNIQASTHWMVTENGLIQPRLESPFEMAQPFDLLAFLNQDTRWENIINLHDDLSKRQIFIDSLWAELERDIDIGTVLNNDDNCLNVGPLNLIDWYTSFLEDGKAKVHNKEFLFNNLNQGDVDVPDCKKISSLTFSMLAFEHLEAMIHRENLSVNSELSMPEQISPVMTVDQLGHWITGVLRKNSSSWVHYNMASLYWRVRGNAPKAIECSRRAVHYAPREYKDIALLSMGLILHRSKMSGDAVVVLGAAVDHDPTCPINHFVIANAYAVLGDFNSSIKHYDMSLKFKPSFELAVKHKAGVLCHILLMQKLRNVQDILHKLREELSQYNYRETHWLKSQAALLRTMKHAEDFDYRDVENNFEKVSKLTGLNVKKLKKDGDKYSLIQYFMEGAMQTDDWLTEKGVLALDSAYNLQRLVRHVRKHTNIAAELVPQRDQIKLTDTEIIKEIGPTPTFPDMFSDVKKGNILADTKANPTSDLTPQGVPKHSSDKKTAASQNEGNMHEYDTGVILYPSSLKISRNAEDFDKDPEWPSNRLCKEAASTFPDNLEAIYQIFLPFENKGIRLHSLLTEKIGVPANVEHDLPWHPPTCPHDKDAAAFTQKKSQKPQIVSDVIITGHLREKLLEYVGNGDAAQARHMQDTEIGQRIYAAMQKKLAPKWVVYTLASLYWRVRAHGPHALHCLLAARAAAAAAAAAHRDLVLVSLASLYLEMGYFDEALAAAEDAFKISLYEPATNFILAELNMIKKHRNTHMFHLKQVVRVEPAFMGGLARNLLHGWACIFKQVNALQELEFGEGDICTQVEPGMSMVCEKDGTNCHVTNIQCFSSHERESSALFRMLELKDDNIQGAAVDDLSRDLFDQVIDEMPPDRADRLDHLKHYETMMKTVRKVLKGCGSKGCSSIRAEDLSLKEEDCTYQHLQLGYWLHIVSLRQLISDADPRLPSDIMSMTPSNKKVPECRLNADPSDDFFLERMSNVDTDGWEPVLSLMHQFAEIFNFYDYVTLGSKIAKYVDTYPESWAGLALAGWWCGAGGRGACAAGCLRAARAARPRAPAPHAPHAPHALRALAVMLHIQSKHQHAKDISYISFYTSPKSKTEAFLVAISHTYSAEYEPAVWMYRYALTFDAKFLPAKACLHATMCLMLFSPADTTSTKSKRN